MAIKASIDIGTNSTRLLIAQIDNKNNIIPITLIDRITRLGKGYTREGNLTLEAMQKVINVLMEYRIIIDKSTVDVSIVFATSATREAKNKAQFLNLIAEKTDFQCRIISGEEEAQLSFKGVQSDMKIPGKCLVCDIGGGSTEFSYAENGEIISSQSLNIGSRRLTTKFIKNDPVTKQELESLEHFLRMELTKHLRSFMPEQCICVGGTATTLAMINENIPLEYPEKAHIPKCL